MSGVISLLSGIGLRIGHRFKKFEKVSELPDWVFICIGVACLYWAGYQAWTDEHSRNQSQVTYIELDTSRATVPSVPLLVVGEKAAFNFGRNNSGSYRADDVYGVAALELHDTASSSNKSDGQMWLTSPAMERAVWDHFIQTHPGPYPKSLFTPGRAGQTFTTALSDHALSADEIADINTGHKVLYLTAFVVWTDAAGTHERRKCQFFHFPPHQPFVLEDSDGYNDFLMKAVN